MERNLAPRLFLCPNQDSSIIRLLIKVTTSRGSSWPEGLMYIHISNNFLINISKMMDKKNYLTIMTSAEESAQPHCVLRAEGEVLGI